MTAPERLAAELKWHEDRSDVYDEKAQKRFRAMRRILDEAGVNR